MFHPPVVPQTLEQFMTSCILPQDGVTIQKTKNTSYGFSVKASNQRKRKEQEQRGIPIERHIRHVQRMEEEKEKRKEYFRNYTLKKNKEKELASNGATDQRRKKGAKHDFLMPRQALWEKNFQDLVQYKNDHGTTIVPFTVPTLGSWVSKLRIKYNAGALPIHQFERLEAIGFVWDLLKHAWDKNYEKLEAYKEAHGTTLVAEEGDKKLHLWCAYQRRHLKDLERIHRLNEIEFIWDTRYLNIIANAKANLAKANTDPDDVANSIARVYFCNRAHPIAKQKYEGATFSELEYLLKDRWKTMTPEQQQPYFEMAAEREDFEMAAKGDSDKNDSTEAASVDYQEADAVASSSLQENQGSVEPRKDWKLFSSDDDKLVQNYDVNDVVNDVVDEVTKDIAVTYDNEDNDSDNSEEIVI